MKGYKIMTGNTVLLLQAQKELIKQRIKVEITLTNIVYDKIETRINRIMANPGYTIDKKMFLRNILNNHKDSRLKRETAICNPLAEKIKKLNAKLEAVEAVEASSK